MLTGLADVAHKFRPARHRALGALVLLHGRGVSEEDLHPLFDVLDPDRHLVGVAPRAPIQQGPGSYHWYRPGPDPASFAEAVDRMDQWLESLSAAVNVLPHKMVLGGFSQGAAMAYALSFKPGRPRPAGILAMSGFWPEVEGVLIDTRDAKGLPVFITHGTEDQVVPLERGQRARDVLSEAGADVEYHEGPVPHAVDPGVLPDLRRWISDLLVPRTG